MLKIFPTVSLRYFAVEDVCVLLLPTGSFYPHCIHSTQCNSTLSCHSDVQRRNKSGGIVNYVFFNEGEVKVSNNNTRV